MTRATRPLPYDARAARRHLVASDERLGEWIGRIGALKLERAPSASLFEALLHAIVYQQLNGKAASTIHGRVLALLPPRRRPRPEDLLEVTPENLRGAGLSRAKLASALDLAEKCADGTLPTVRRLENMDDEVITESLVQVRGIGVWSAQMFMMFNLGRPDVLPATDYGVLQGYMHVLGRKTVPKPKALERRAERWRPFRSAASWYLYRAVDLARSESAE